MRRRLGVVTIAVTSMMAIAFLVPLGLLIRDQARDRALAEAQRQADAAAAALAVAASLQPEGITPRLTDAVAASFGSQDTLSIVLTDGYVAGQPDVVTATVEAARSGAAFTATAPGGAEVLVPVAVGAEAAPAVIRVFVPDDELTQGVAQAWTVLALLGALLVLAAVALADRLGRSVTGPMAELASAADRLGEGHLDHRVEPSGVPELAEVAEAFNALAGRLRRLLDAEREAVADLSHRLRTPLAALRLGVETLPPSEDREALLQDVRHLERAVGELIADARRGSAPGPERADAAEVARQRATFWGALAGEQDRGFASRVPPAPAWVPVAEEELATAIDTLIENVFTHTEAGVAFSLSVDVRDHQVVITVADEGPGIATHYVDRGVSGRGSTGLGLDIVTRMARRARGELLIGPPPGGVVTIQLPRV